MLSPTISYLRGWALYHMEKVSSLFKVLQRFLTTAPKRIRELNEGCVAGCVNFTSGKICVDILAI